MGTSEHGPIQIFDLSGVYFSVCSIGKHCFLDLHVRLIFNAELESPGLQKIRISPRMGSHFQNYKHEISHNHMDEA